MLPFCAALSILTRSVLRRSAGQKNSFAGVAKRDQTGGQATSLHGATCCCTITAMSESVTDAVAPVRQVVAIQRALAVFSACTPEGHGELNLTTS
jgi:hypothetical protein